MHFMDVLKKVKTICWRALGNNRWHVALRALERQAKYVGPFEGQCLPPQCPSKVTRVASKTRQQGSAIMEGVAKLHSALKHPPPTGA